MSEHSDPANADSAAQARRAEAEVADGLIRLLSKIDLAQPELESALLELEHQHHDAVYAELLFLLCHLRFDAKEAREHWSSIVAHRNALEASLGSPVDVRVALVSYFLQVNRKLRSPKIIELQLFEQTQAQAMRDELTGLFNYRYFGTLLDAEVDRHRRHGLPLSLAMIDIDEFKRFNDTYGHQSGNEALAAIAAFLVTAIRQSDQAARYGGEEFAVLLPATGKDHAALVTERVRDGIERISFPAGPSGSFAHLTVSIGLATLPADAATGAELIRGADRALYEAKGAGRNRVRLYGASQRSFRRSKCMVPASVHVASPAGIPVRVGSLSAGGLGFSSSVPLELDTVVEIRLALPGIDDPVRVVGSVASDRSAPGGGHLIGVQFEAIRSLDRRRLLEFLEPRR